MPPSNYSLDTNEVIRIYRESTIKVHGTMSDHTTDSDGEFSAMHAVYAALAPLDEDARIRVVDYIVARFEISARPAPGGHPAADAGSQSYEDTIKEETAVSSKFGSFAELYDAAQPKNQSEKALVAGYWLQVCQGAGSFDGFSANKELKNLGQGVGNITVAIDSLKNQKPALALQLKKSGKSQQARKTYKITVAGIKSVEGMIHG
jgi:hypothetical protein